MEKNKENKNNLRSIMIIILYFIFPYVMKFLSGVKWLVVLLYMLFALLILYLYRNTFKKDFKDIIENKKKYLSSILINVALIFVIMLITNALIGMLFDIKQTSENDYSLLAMFKKSPIILMFLTSLYYPVIEGVIFRKSVRDIIDNKWIFIIFSSIPLFICIFFIVSSIIYIVSFITNILLPEPASPSISIL